MPEELNEILNSLVEDDYSFLVTGVNYTTDNPVIDVRLITRANDEDSVSQCWRIETTSTKKAYLSYEFADFIAIETEHPLLWEFTGPHCELYFSGYYKDKAKLFYDLFVAHKRIFTSYQCFNILPAIHESQLDFFQYSNGLLASGSKKLMDVYADCLQQNGLDFTMIDRRGPGYWSGGAFVPEPKGLKVLFIGQSFIIARDFKFIRID